jgi:hypothetical protein
MTVLNASEWGTERGLTPTTGINISTEDGAVHATPLDDPDGQTAAVDLGISYGARTLTETLTLADASTLVTALIDMGAVDGRAGERMGPGLRAKADGHERLAASSPALAPAALTVAKSLRALADGLQVADGLATP